jgi:transcriptional regulator with XRE-family HTH domain
MLLFGRGDLMEYDSVAIGYRAMASRNNKNLTQKEVAAVIGIHQATYSKFELGQHDLHGEQYIKLSNYLGISVSWLLGEDSIPELTDSERLEVDKFIKYIIGIRGK